LDSRKYGVYVLTQKHLYTPKTIQGKRPNDTDNRPKLDDSLRIARDYSADRW